MCCIQLLYYGTEKLLQYDLPFIHVLIYIFGNERFFLDLYCVTCKIWVTLAQLSRNVPGQFLISEGANLA